MYYKEVAKKAYDYVLERFAEQREMEQNGGALRNFSGKTVENMMELIFNEFSNYYKPSNMTFIIGSESPVILGDNVLAESVDKHFYVNNKLVCGIECKTYVDKCYMQRADSDFNLMKTNLQFDGWIVSLENGVSDKASNFFMSRPNINKLFYLADGKRNSEISKRIYYHPERLNIKLFEELCKNMEKYFI